MIKGNTDIARALALSLWVKNRFMSSTINNFSYNKLHLLTGLHINTIKKRISTLKSLGLVRFEHGHLVFSPLTSKSKFLSYDFKELQGMAVSPTEKEIMKKNKDTEKITTLLVRDFEKYLYSLQVVVIQRRKDFVKQTFESLKYPDTLEEYRKAKRICKRYGYHGEYKEFGLSYKRIAKELDVSIQKAFDVVRFAVMNGILAKIRNQKQEYIKNAKKVIGKYLNDYTHTFCTKDNAYLILANVYIVLD